MAATAPFDGGPTIPGPKPDPDPRPNPSRRDPSRPFKPGWRAVPGRVRPMVPVAIAMAVGIVVDRFVDPWGTAVWATIALVGSAIAWMTIRRTWAVYPALLVAISAFGGGWHHARWSDLAADDLARVVSTEPRPGWVRGFIRTVPEHRDGLSRERPDDQGYTRFELQITAASDGRAWHPASGRAIASVGGDRTDLQMGDPIEAAGSLALLAGPLNPGERDPRDYHRSRGVRLRFSVDDPEGITLDPSGRPRPMLRWLGWVRSWSARQLRDRLDDRAAPVALALLLGRRGEIDEETADAFSRTGTAHLLAISGLHLSAVAGGLWLLSVLLGLRPKPGAWLVLSATIGYATLVGWSPSVGRSAVMVAAVCLAMILDRSTRISNTIALAAVITLLINPCFLFGVGWQLSFLAVSVLAIGVPPMLSRLRAGGGRDEEGEEDPLDALERRLEPGWIRSSRRIAFVPVAALLASAAVSLATMPLVAWRFNLVAPIGILLNLPMIPMAGIAVSSGGAALVLSGVWGPLAAPAAWLCNGMLGGTLAIIDRAEAIPSGHTFVPTPPLGWVVAFYAMLALAMRASVARWPRGARRSAWLGVAVVAAMGSAETLRPHRPPTIEVEALAVGHGLATVIQSPDGLAALYDCGRSGDPSVGRRIAAPALWNRGIRRLETVVISHADSDHYNGVPDLLERFGVGRLVVPEGFVGSGNPGASGVLDEARALGIPIREVTAGDRIELVPGLDATVLHPPPGWLPDAPDNDRSLVLDLAPEGGRLLLTGDLDGSGLAELVASPAFPIDAMLAPHHGGRSSNPPWLYEWASPSIVVSSQRAPRAGSTDPLAWLDDRGIAVYRTWKDGAIRLRWEHPDGSSGPELVADRLVPDRIGPDDANPRGRFVLASIGLGLPPGATRWLVAIVGLLLGAWLALAMAVVQFGAWSLVLPGRSVVPIEPFPDPWRSVSIVSGDGVRLRGWQLDANGPSPDGSGRVAIVLHGMAEASPSMRGRAEALHRSGWSVLVPDLRSFGRSEGDRCSFGSREAGDLRAWVDALLADRPGSLVVAWGRSMGAAVALRAAVEDDRIRAVILEAPYADLRRALASRLGRLPIPGASMLAGLVLRRASALAGAPLGRPRPIELAPRVSVPVLVLQGGRDRVAPIAEVRRLLDAFPEDRRPEVETVPDAGHGDVFDLGGPALADRVVAFLGRAGSPAGPPDPSG